MEEILVIVVMIEEVVFCYVLWYCYWVFVGNGSNLMVVEEICIKFLEFCYKLIVCDVIEDKKYIDFLFELLIFVCVMGFVGLMVDDVVKEVVIYKVYKVILIVIVSQGD